MSNALSPQAERHLQRAVDVAERIFVLLLFTAYAVRVWRSLALEPSNVLAVISEGLVVFFILIRRDATEFTVRPADWAIALGGTALALFVKPGGHPFLPGIVGTALMVTGLSLAITSKLTLRRSFGVAAANRGVVLAGPYAFVRHPMYAGYVLVYAGFLLNNPLPWNLAVYAATLSLLVARIAAEERVLAKDPRYADFMSRVRYRLAPGLF
ncbi:MAG TPA: methyltransferase [Rhizomicrobium sp.]|jgi:protein-S-isoprenylcysteine O-methyltransferase Ste14